MEVCEILVANSRNEICSLSNKLKIKFTSQNEKFISVFMKCEEKTVEILTCEIKDCIFENWGKKFRCF